MNKRMRIIAALLLAALLLAGCGSAQKVKTPETKPGVVYLDPNAPKAEGKTDAPQPAETAAPTATEAPAAPETQTAEGETEAEDPASPTLELYFESKGVRMKPLMEAAPVLEALGTPVGHFEADSCAYIGKDLFYYYPGFELTVNEVDGVNLITAILVADDTVTIPQGLRIYDEEEKLLSLLGGSAENGVYTYRQGDIELLIQVKDAEEDVRRVATMEYRVADDQREVP